jgi:Kef-type K+ transport system membrane component KefB
MTQREDRDRSHFSPCTTTRAMGMPATGSVCARLFMEKLAILRQSRGQRILRYASLDDIAIWGVLALILLDELS